MNSSGIVRRIDELGRIVIPKELRRTMRLKEGDEMEINASGDSLSLRKYSSFEAVLSGARAIAKLLVDATGADVLLTSSTKVIIAEGKNKKEYADAKLSEGFSQTVLSRKSEVLHGEDVKTMLEGKECTCCYVVTEPVFVSGDFAGTMVLVLDTLPSDLARAYLHFSVELLKASLS